MMGHRQKLKTASEYDFIYARGQYCYMVNHGCKLKKSIKRSLAKRRRIDDKKIIMRECHDNI